MKALKMMAAMLVLVAVALVTTGCKDDADKKAADVVAEVLQDVAAGEVTADVDKGEVAPRQDINLEEFPTIVDAIPQDLPPVMDILPKEMIEEVAPPQDINLEEMPVIKDVVAEAGQ
jgi:hypothetical protein